MLRPNKFRPFETRILFGVAFFLLGVAVIAIFLAIQHAHWRLALASVGILVLATVYWRAAKRGRPL